MLHLVTPTTGSGRIEQASAAVVRPEMDAARLAAVDRYGILGTVPEPAFDRIAALAAELFAAPVALIGFVGTDRVFFKSHHGSTATQAPRGTDPAALVLAPWLAREFPHGFHACVPLESPDGHEIGLLAVIDRRPRRIDETLMRRLRSLGRIVTDILAMRLAAREAIALAEVTDREVDHRTMNSLQFVASLLQLQSRAVQSPETTQHLLAAANRVRAVAKVHRTFSLHPTSDRVPMVAHLRKLGEELSTSLGIEIAVVAGDEVNVPKTQVLPLGLIVNELVANAHKHAAGAITIFFSDAPGNGGRAHHELSVLDEGGGLPDKDALSDGAGTGTGTGLGMKLVDALVSQLQGSLTTGNNPAGRGACVTVSFPAT